MKPKIKMREIIILMIQMDEIDAALKDTNLPQFEELLSGAKSVAEKTRTGQQPNAYYCPEFVTSFLRFATYYVLWTNVMIKITNSKYSVASSARSETYFNDVKNITFSDDRPIRIDKFIIKHIRSIESICKIERAALNNRIIQDNNFKEMDVLKRDKSKFLPNINEENNDVEQYLIAEENWRGLNPHKRKESSLDISKRKRGKYLTAYPDISLIHNRT